MIIFYEVAILIGRLLASDASRRRGRPAPRLIDRRTSTLDSLPARGDRRARRGRVGAGRGAHRIGQDRRRRARRRSGPGRGRQGLLHHADQGAVEPEVRRPARRHGADRVGLLTGDNAINGDAAGGGHDHRGPAQHDLRAVAGARRTCASSCSTRSTTSRTPTAGRCGRRSSSTSGPRPPGVPLGDRVERRGAGRLDRDRARPDGDGDRGRAPRRAAQPLLRRRPSESEQLHLLPTLVDGRPNPEADDFDDEAPPGAAARSRGAGPAAASSPRAAST